MKKRQAVVHSFECGHEWGYNIAKSVLFDSSKRTKENLHQVATILFRSDEYSRKKELTHTRTGKELTPALREHYRGIARGIELAEQVYSGCYKKNGYKDLD